jgi:hypothetical protein
VHFLEAEDADGAALLFGPRVVGTDADALERVEVADFVVIASSAIAERERRMPTAPVVARPSFVSMCSTRARVWRRRSSCIGQSLRAVPSISTPVTRETRCS